METLLPVASRPRPLNHLRLIRSFIGASAQQEMAYRANFYIHLLHSTLNLAVGILGILVLFGQIDQLHGWDFPAVLGLMGVYLVVGALRGLFIGPGLEALAGMGQEIWSGTFDFTLLRPVNTQFLVTFRRWELFSLLDLGLGVGVIGFALVQSGRPLLPGQLLAFFFALLAAVVILYAALLAFTALVFWSPGFLYTWVFDALFQLARYPVGIYPPWLRIILTWIVPVGLITTVPAQALAGQASLPMLLGVIVFAAALLAGASWLFRFGLRRYASASS